MRSEVNSLNNNDKCNNFKDQPYTKIIEEKSNHDPNDEIKNTVKNIIPNGLGSLNLPSTKINYDDID